MRTARLIYGSSESNADSFYLGNIFIPDPFFAIEIKGKSYALLSKLEFERARKHSRFDHVLSYEKYAASAKKVFPKSEGLLGVLKLFQKEHGVDTFAISKEFPIGLGNKLKRLGLVIEEDLFPERQTKSEEECRLIRKSNQVAEKGFCRVVEILKSSKIQGNKLYFRGKILRSEFLRQEIEIEALRNNALAAHTIAASGKQSAAPHNVGTGPVYANQFLIVDIFPRSTQSGYFGDMSRTFLPGTPSTEQEKMYLAVREAQKLAIQKLKAGVTGASIHKTAESFFEKEGFSTTQTEGFIHSIGHGLGLDIHELPRLSPNADKKIKAGNVVTIEPGLYFKHIGGVRIEDVFAVTNNTPTPLSKFPYTWIIK